MNYIVNIRTFVLLLLISISKGFLPNFLYRCTVDSLSSQSASEQKIDHTHESITQLALQKAIDDLIDDGYITDNGDWEESKRQALQDIMSGSRELDKLGHNKAVNHLNGEQLDQGNDKLILWRKRIRELYNGPESPYKYTLIRYLIGQMLHLIQDFYSNTGWVEVMKDERQNGLDHFYGNLGLENKKFLPVDKAGTLAACSDKPPKNDSKGSQGNVIHRYLSSGYRSGQDIAKLPLKCSHGGIYDSSALIVPRGGINSESHNDSLSPKFYLHRNSSRSAIAHSHGFLKSSDIGLLSLIPGKDLLAILGVGERSHISLLQTDTLYALSRSLLWKYTLRTERQTWPWDVNHLYTASGDQAGVEMDSYIELSGQSVTSSQSTILGAAMSLPENSNLILVTKYENPIEGDWDEDMLKKILIQRKTRLFSFVLRTPQSSGSEGSRPQALDRVSKSTQGEMLYISNAHELLEILTVITPNQHITRYELKANSDESVVILPAQKSMLLVITCAVEQTDRPLVIPTSFTRILLASTTYVTIYNITSQRESHSRMITTIPASLINQCKISTWSSQALVHTYPVSDSFRGQIYPSTMRVRDRSRIVAEVSPVFHDDITPLSLGLTPAGVGLYPFHKCAYDSNRTELRQSYMSDILRFRRPEWLDIVLKFNEENFIISEYINEQHVEIIAPKVIAENTTRLDIVITNIRSRTSFTFSVLNVWNDIDVSVNPESSTVEAFTELVNVTLRSQQLQYYKRPITFLVTGVDPFGLEFHAAHTFYPVSFTSQGTTTGPTTSTPTTTVTTTVTTKTTTPSTTTKATTPTTVTSHPVSTHTVSKETTPKSQSTKPPKLTTQRKIDMNPESTYHTPPIHAQNQSIQNTNVSTTPTNVVVDHGDGGASERLPRLLIISLVGTVSIAVVLILVIAAAQLVYHKYCKGTCRHDNGGQSGTNYIYKEVPTKKSLGTNDELVSVTSDERKIFLPPVTSL